MFEALMAFLNAAQSALYSGANGPIAATCGIAWTYAFGPIAGIVVGFALLRGFYNDDLSATFWSVFEVMIPLFVIAWLIKPGGEAGCRAVSVKNDVLALRTLVTNAAAPEFAGAPTDMIGKSSKKMQKILDEFNQKIQRSIDNGVENQTTDKKPRVTPPKEIK